MRQVNGEKEYVLIQGGLTDMAEAMKLAAVAQIRFIVRSQQRP
jgi:hypothetical protein